LDGRGDALVAVVLMNQFDNVFVEVGSPNSSRLSNLHRSEYFSVQKLVDPGSPDLKDARNIFRCQEPFIVIWDWIIIMRDEFNVNYFWDDDELVLQLIAAGG
jgi:hypothetical protein